MPEPHPTALSLARSLRRREISSTELVEQTLDRVDTRNPALGAYVQVLASAARREAARLDRELDKGRPKGTFHGVPTGIKDLDPVRWSFNRAGSRAYRYAWTPGDGPVARSTRAGGFVITGKLATSELAILPMTETDLHPPCRNPWSPEHSAGGSSGGSASAVAAGLLPVALGSDGAGSIRIPSAFCHLFGYKPSRGLLPDYYRAVDRFGLSTVNGLCHDVADAAAMLDTLQGRAWDPTGPAPEGSLSAALDQPPARLTIRVSVQSFLGQVEPCIERAVHETADRLQALGHHVEEGPVMDDLLDTFIPVYGKVSGRLPVIRESVLQPLTRWLRAEGRKVSDDEAMKRCLHLRQVVAAWWGQADAWLTPTVAELAPPIGLLDGMEPADAFRRAARLGAFTAPFNISGQPAASLPAGVSEDGLPFGVQLAMRQGADTQLLALCRQLEAAAPWRQRTPPN